MRDDYEPFDVPEFGMSYEEESDFEEEPVKAGTVWFSDTVPSLWRNYIMDPERWDMTEVKEQIEAIIAGRTECENTARANRSARGKAERAAAQKRWNGGMNEPETMPSL